MRNDLSLARMLGTVARVEQTAWEGTRRYKCVVVRRLERAGTVAVDGLQRLVIGDRNMIWSDTDEFACVNRKKTASSTVSMRSGGTAEHVKKRVRRHTLTHHTSDAVCEPPRSGDRSELSSAARSR